MQDIYNYFPYKSKNYDNTFISLKVLQTMHEFAKKHEIIDKIIDKIYAKGSLIYGTMVEGSDIDHVRIKVNKPLTLDQKIKLVNELEECLKIYNISKVQRIKENNYVRVFYDYNELIKYPRALTIKDEVYPVPHILRAKTKCKFVRKLFKRAYKYCGYVSQEWIEKTKERINVI